MSTTRCLLRGTRWKTTIRAIATGLLVGAAYAIVIVGTLMVSIELSTGGRYVKEFARFAVSLGSLAGAWGGLGGALVGLVIVATPARQSRQFAYCCLCGIAYGCFVELISWGHVEGAIAALSLIGSMVIFAVVRKWEGRS